MNRSPLYGVSSTGSANLPLIDISDLQKLPFSGCHPPLTRAPRGCPKKKRFRKDKTRGPRGEAAAHAMAEPAGDGEEDVWSPYHCSTCGEQAGALFYDL